MNTTQTTPTPPTDVDVAVVGAGFGGLAMCHALTRLRGLRFVVLERGPRIGGTWRDNRYPGCACDIPAHLYSLSFAPNPDWPAMFAPQPDILAYMDRVAERIGLPAHLRLNTAVTEARWHEADRRWHLTLSGGEIMRATFLITAMGVLHKVAFPDIEGRDSFAGQTLHSAMWNDAARLEGQRVGVIGTGASAVQLVPQVAKIAAALTVFQRTPPWIAPKFDRPIPPEQRAKFAKSPLARWRFRARLWWAHEKRARGFISQDPAIQQKTEALCRAHLHRHVSDPALRAKLTPSYAVGCKRLLISNDYYPALQQSHVILETTPIARIVPEGVVDTAGRLHAFDALIFATGFDVHHALAHLPLFGTGAQSLQARWEAEGASAYLGTTVHGFPNLFIMTGPNAGSGHTSQLFMLEAQASYIAQAIARVRARRRRAIEVTAEAQARFDAEMARRLGHTVWHAGGCQSWYLDHRGRNTVLWPSLSIDYWWRTRRLRDADYRYST